MRKRYSIRPVLQFLNDLEGLKFIHRDIGTAGELEFYVKKWTQARYKKYQVGYFSFHGSPGELCFADNRRKSISLDELADWLAGKARDRIIHFGACSVMNIDDRDLRDFRKLTEAAAVTGYREDVQWREAPAFEVLMLGALCDYQRISAAEKYLRTNFGELWDRLGVKIIR